MKKRDPRGKGLAFCESLYGDASSRKRKVAKPSEKDKQPDPSPSKEQADGEAET